MKRFIVRLILCLMLVIPAAEAFARPPYHRPPRRHAPAPRYRRPPVRRPHYRRPPVRRPHRHYHRHYYYMF